MAYIEQIDVEAFTGYGAEDMKQAGLTMTASQWDDYCTNDLIPRVEQMFNRCCGVTTFEPHTKIEYASSPGEMDYLNDYMSWMTPGGPGVSVTDIPEFVLVDPCIEVASVAIKENIWVDSWLDLIKVGSEQGEWYSETQDELTHIYINVIPPVGRANIRFTYTAGYPEGSEQYREIQMIILRIIRINLEEKLKFQQAGTIRNVGTKDYMEMYDINKQKHRDQYYIPEDILNEIRKYRRMLFSQGV